MPILLMVLRALKPGALSVLIFCTVVVPCSVYLSPPFATWRYYTGSLFIGYLLAKILAFAFQQATGFRRPARAYSCAAAIVLALALLAGIGLSKSYWGYFLFRPPPLVEIADVLGQPVVAVVATPDDADAQSDFVVHPSGSPDKDLAYARRNPYDAPEGRLLLELNRRGQLPAAYATSLSHLPPLLPLVRRSGLIVPAEPGYDGDRQLGGYVVDAVDSSGTRLVFLAICGSQISNDHYPYYEMLFMAPPGSSDLKHVRSQMFFYDVAGIEGAEWYVMGLGFWLMGMPIVFIAMTVVMGVGRGIAQIRKEKRAAVAPPVSPA